MLADDFYYSQNLVYGENVPAQSLTDVLHSAANAYTMSGGRVLTHIVYHIFGFAGREVFVVINSISYMLTTFLLYSIIRTGGRHSISLFIIINLSVWIFTPELGQDIFWISGAVNYLFPMIPILGIICLYRRYADKPSDKNGILKCVSVFLLGAVAGCQQENSSLTVPVTAFLYILYYRRSGLKIPKWSISGLCGSVIGYAVLLFAPGNFHRYEKETQNVSLSFPFKFAMITYYWIMFVGVLTVIFVAAVIVCRRKGLNAPLKQGCIFAVAALVSAYCMIAAPTSPERTWFITVVLMTAAAGIPLHALYGNTSGAGSSLKALVCSAALVILGTMAADTMLATYDIHKQFVQREEIILTAKENGVTVVKVPVYRLKYPLKANCYALYNLYDVELGEASPNSFNSIIAQYYGIDTIIGV